MVDESSKLPDSDEDKNDDADSDDVVEDVDDEDSDRDGVLVHTDKFDIEDMFEAGV
jgi:hypothetical protein